MLYYWKLLKCASTELSQNIILLWKSIGTPNQKLNILLEAQNKNSDK